MTTERTIEPTNALLDATALAGMFNVSEKTIYRWTNSRKIPSYRIGNTVRYDVGQVLEEMRGGI